MSTIHWVYSKLDIKGWKTYLNSPGVCLYLGYSTFQLNVMAPFFSSPCNSNIINLIIHRTLLSHLAEWGCGFGIETINNFIQIQIDFSWISILGICSSNSQEFWTVNSSEVWLHKISFYYCNNFFKWDFQHHNRQKVEKSTES